MMKITYKSSPDDPLYPFMHGDTAFAKEFNKRQEKLFKDGKITKAEFEQIYTVIIEVLIDDYNRRHGPRKKRK